MNHKKPRILMRSPNDIIRSAEQVAFVRALAANERDPQLRNPDYLAKYFIRWRWRIYLRPVKLFRWILEQQVPGIYNYHIARTKHFDKTLLQVLKENVKQIVFLGAGNDTRSYRFQKFMKDIKIFELDFPGTQKRKKEKLIQLFGNLPAHVHYIPIDFSSESLEKVLLKQGYQKELKTFFVWEGVSYYLAPEAVDKVLSFITHHSPVGSSILFDYSLRSFIEGDRNTYAAKEFDRWLKSVGEPFLFGLNAFETSDFFAKRNFKLLSDFSAEELNCQYVTQADGSLRGPITGHFRMAHAGVV